MTRSRYASAIPYTTLPVPGFAELILCVYGQVHASTLTGDMQQGYVVRHEGKPVARAELPAKQKAAVRALLQEKFPEHATL